MQALVADTSLPFSPFAPYLFCEIGESSPGKVLFPCIIRRAAEPLHANFPPPLEAPKFEATCSLSFAARRGTALYAFAEDLFRLRFGCSLLVAWSLTRLPMP